MKLLYVHETKFKEDEKGNYYTNGSYNQNVWNRYLSISTQLSVIARKEDKIYDVEDAEKSFNYFNKNKITFIEVPDKVKSVKDMFNYSNNKVIRKIIKNEVSKSDAVIVRLPSVYGDIAAQYAIKFNVPYLIEVVGCVWDSLWNHSWKGKLLAPKRFYETKNIVYKAPFVIYVTNNFLQKKYPTKGISTNCSNVMISNIDEEILDKRLNKIEDMSKRKIIRLGTIGATDVKYKGQEKVIKALGQLKLDGKSNFEYQLVGGGNQTYLKEVAKKNNIEDSLKFIGSLPHNKVKDWLDSVDIYIQPSLTEGLPRALIEAMSRGVPSLGTNVGGIPELLDTSSIIYKKNSHKEIYSILLKVANDKKWYLSNSKRNFEVSKQYNKYIIEARRSKLLKELVFATKNAKKNTINMEDKT